MSSINQWFDKKWVRKQFTIHKKWEPDLAIYLKVKLDQWNLTFKGLDYLTLDNVRFRIVDRNRTKQRNLVECYDASDSKTLMVTLEFSHKGPFCCVKPVFDGDLPLKVSSSGDSDIDHLV